MTFQARKTRQRRKPDPVGVGKPLTPSAAIRIWYKRELMLIVNSMLADYKAKIAEALEHHEIQRFYAQDAAADDYWQRLMGTLEKKWDDIFNGFAAKTVPEFIVKADDHAKSSTWFSLNTAGIEQPRQVYNENIDNTLKSATAFNKTLITGIHKDAHERIYNSIMLSLTSPDPAEQGSSGIQNALKKEKDISEDRVDLITRDQTSKLNSSLTTERMSQAGVEYFKWAHSSAGKVPRESHTDMNGGIFKVSNDPRLWQVGNIEFATETGNGSAFLKKGDLGPPGWAINCRCRAMPLIGYNDTEDDD
jgi:Phage Mu protein F like protein